MLVESGVSRSWIALERLAKLAPTTSILLTNTSRGTPYLFGLPPDRLRLGLDALLGVEDDDRAVEDAQAAARPRR